MSRSKRAAKMDWHALSLQQLTTPEFIRVVNLILAEEYSLMPDVFQDRDCESSGCGLEDLQPVRAADTLWAVSQDILAIEYA